MPLLTKYEELAYWQINRLVFAKYINMHIRVNTSQEAFVRGHWCSQPAIHLVQTHDSKASINVSSRFSMEIKGPYGPIFTT